MYFTADETSTDWFFYEILMWATMPILGLGLSFLLYNLVKKHIYNYTEATKRVVKLLPYQITFSFTLMWYVALVKNFLKSKEFRKLHNNFHYFALFLSLLIAFPIVVLPLSRFYLLRRARNVEWISSGRQKQTKQLMKSMRDMSKTDS
jgi:Na+/serine symporter